MDQIKETDNRRESNVQNSQRDRRSRRKGTCAFKGSQEDARKPHLRGRRSVSNETTKRRKEKRQRESSASIERQRKRSSDKDEQPPPTRRSKRRSLRSSERRQASSVYSGSSRSLSDAPVIEGDKFSNARRRTKQSQPSNRHLLRSDSVRQRKRTTGNDEELPPTRHAKRRSRRDSERRHASSVSSGSSRSLSDAAVNENDKFNHARRRTKHPQRSKRHSIRSGSVQDDSTGHFRIRAGSIIGNRYKILREVGLGTFGRVVECFQIPDRNQDRSQHSSREPDRHVAIKIVRNVKRYYESAVIEARIISEANRRGGRGRTHCVLLHDTFRIDGHFCLVFENLGPSLYDFLKRNNHRPFPMFCVQDFTVQLLETLEFLHGIRMIHTDLKIENILLMNDREINYRDQIVVPESTKIKLIDFGSACYDSDKKSSVINTRQYRAPEVSFQ